MLKEFKTDDRRIINIDLNEISIIDFFDYEDNESKIYEITIHTKAGFNFLILKEIDYQKALDFYNKLLQAYKESQMQIDTEKRLKAYIQDIDNKVAIEVKKYLDKITGK